MPNLQPCLVKKDMQNQTIRQFSGNPAFSIVKFMPGSKKLFIFNHLALSFDQPYNSKTFYCNQSLVHMADVRISIGCLSSHRLNTLKAIIPASIGHCPPKAAALLLKILRLIFWATHRL